MVILGFLSCMWLIYDGKPQLVIFECLFLYMSTLFVKGGGEFVRPYEQELP